MADDYGFSSLSNSGSLGGDFSQSLGTSIKDPEAINGFDAIKFNADSAIGINAAVFAGGNICVSYVCKRLGNPASNELGAIISQSAQQPGWVIYEQINISTSLSNGHAVVPGNVALNGWPSANTNTDKDAIFNPPTDDSTWHINTAKFGTEHLWRYDGKALVATYATDHTIPASTGVINIGTSYGGQNANIDLGFLIVNQDPTSDELIKIEGLLAWYYGLQTKLPTYHPCYLEAPKVDSIPDVKEWNKTAYDGSYFIFYNKDKSCFKNTTDGAGDWFLYSRAMAKTGKWCSSVKIDNYEYGNVGLVNDDNTVFIAYQYDGAIITSAGGVGTLAAYAAPSKVDIFFDLGAMKVWFRVDGGNWNGNASYDPETGVGGYTIPASSKGWHVGAYCPYFGGSRRTLYTQTSDFTSIPSGFQPFAKARGE